MTVEHRSGARRTGTSGVGVQSLRRALGLLEIMADAGGEIALSELATASGLPVPTTHRIVRTMVEAGHVRQLPSRRYVLGPRLIKLGEVASQVLGAWARPRLAALVEATGETASLALLDGDRAVYVAQVPSAHTMRLFTEVGRHVRLHSTGLGKALLAQLPTEVALDLVRGAGMSASTDRTIVDPEVLRAELVRVRVNGFALDEGEHEVGLRCIGVAVPGSPSVMAISISGPAARLTEQSVVRLAPVVQSFAAQLSADFGDPPTG